MTSTTDPEGDVTNYTYDTDGDLASVTTHPSSTVADTTTSTYDAQGEVVCETSPDATAAGVTCPAPGSPRVADTTTWTYNADGQVTSTTNPSGDTTTSTYDADGNQISATDPMGHVTETTYDADDRVTSLTQGHGTSSAATTSDSYDLAPGTASCSSAVAAATYCTTTTDPDGLVTTDYFNARTEEIETTSPNASTTTDAYDLTGNLVTKVTPSGKATYAYDADNQLTSITYSDATTATAAPNVTYSYNADGQRTQMTDGTGTTTYTYDSLGRLSSTTDGAGSTVSYAYNADNEVTSITYPGTRTVTQAYDGAGQETSVTDWLGHTTSFSYDPDGSLTTQTSPNATTATYAYNATDQVTSITAKNTTTTLASFSYTRNANGLVATETDAGVPAPTSETYSYGPLTELVSTSAGSYTYDPAGDLTKLASGATLSYSAGSEKLAKLTEGSSTTSFAYDGDGERKTQKTTSTSATYAYDQAGDLTGVNGSGTYFSTVTSLSAGDGTTCAVTSTQSAYCWGTNSSGQLGDGSRSSSSVPVEVALATVTSISVGDDTTCAVTAAKNAYCWGTNNYGQLGNGTSTPLEPADTPVEVVGPGDSGHLTTVTAIASGYRQTCAVTSASSDNVYCWGTGSTSPVEVDLSTVTSVSAGGTSIPQEKGDTVCAVTSEKKAYCWGNNNDGQFGDGNTTSSATPVEVDLSTVTQISVGDDRSVCAVTTSKDVYCWGTNEAHQLGGYYTASSDAPYKVDLSTVTGVSQGDETTCAVTSGANVYCWGANYSGQRGEGTITTKPGGTLTEVVGPGGSGYLSTATSATVGQATTCARTSAGNLYCWGSNTAGALGDGESEPTKSASPVEVVAPSAHLSTVSAISVGDGVTCAVTSAKNAYCWGNNRAGQLGGGTTTSSTTPVEVLGPGGSGHLTTVTSIAAGDLETCAVTAATSDNVYCWGEGSTSPVKVDLSTATSISAGGSGYKDTICALSAKKDAYCWGTNQSGQLGDGNTTSSSTPVEVDDLSTVTGIAVGDDKTVCAVVAAGHAYCWGATSTTPVEVDGLPAVTGVFVGDGTTCALSTAKNLYCWGANRAGQVGDGKTSRTGRDVSEPTKVVGPGGSGDLSTVTTAAVGAETTCAATTAKVVYCWGSNFDGELGDGKTTITGSGSSSPIEVVGPGGAGDLSTVAALSAGGTTLSSTCALSTAKNVYCWGANVEGELGDGLFAGSSTPQEVTVRKFKLYAYNGDGLLVSRSVGNTEEQLTWNLDTPGGNPQLLVAGKDDYVYGPTGLPLEQISGTTVLYYVHDQLGSTRLLTSSSGSVVATYTYDPYGQLSASTGAVTNPFGFSGAYTDSASGLLYLTSRWYTPATGQFLSVDPDVSTTDQPYAYTAGDPVNATDPSGDIATTGEGGGDTSCTPRNNCTQAAYDRWAESELAATEKYQQSVKSRERALSNIASKVAHSISSAAKAVATAVRSHWKTELEVVATVAAVVSIATGVGALVGTGLLMWSAGQAAVVSGIAGAISAAASDLPSCVNGNQAGCVRAGLGAVAGATGALGGFGSDISIVRGLARALGFASGVGNSAFDWLEAASR